MVRNRRARKAMMVALTAASLSSAMVLDHATDTDFMVRLTAEVTNSVIGVGGLGDNLGERVPAKLSGTVVPPGYTYVPLLYDSTLNLAASRDAGVPLLNQVILDRSSDQHIIATGYSAGALVIEQDRRTLQALDPADAPSNTQLSFVTIADPFAPNGGVFGRFSKNIVIPGLINFMGPGVPTRYDTTYVANEYDPYGDFPAYFNPVALLNTILAIRYSHPDEAYNPVQPGVTPSFTTTVHNGSTGSTDTYVLYYSNQLPLLGPIREIARQIPFGTALTEPELSAIEPLLRVIVDMAYTDRKNLDPATPTPFSLTPPAKFIEAVSEVPGALVQGLTNLLAGHNVAPPPASETHEVTTPAVVATPKIKTTTSAALQQSNTQPQQKDSTDGADPSASGITSGSEAGSLVGSGSSSTTPDPTPAADVAHPTLTATGGKATPTTTTPTKGFGQGPVSKLLTSLFGGRKSATTPSTTGTTTSGGTQPSGGETPSGGTQPTGGGTPGSSSASGAQSASGSSGAAA